MTRGQKALTNLLEWSGNNEIDLYPYIREVFTDLFGYPKNHVRLTERGSQGRIPDLSLSSVDARPKEAIYWIVGEAKKGRGVFRSKGYRKDRWEKQLKDYITADTIYALLIDPVTIAVLRPDGTEVKVVELDTCKADDLLSSIVKSSLDFLHYENSVCEKSLSSFKEGISPSRYLDVTTEDDRKKFYEALRISAGELIDFSLEKLQKLGEEYRKYQMEVDSLKDKVGTVNDQFSELTISTLEKEYREARDLFENTLEVFKTQIGRKIPTEEEDSYRFLQNLYATEGSSLVLARILFVRFLEDNDMTMRKISNGGIKAFRDYHRYIKDDYQFLLTDAYREAEQLYHRLFEPSIFDWSHKGDGELSRLLLRIFYRLNAFDFSKISGDILGNLYERFLDINKRKKLGEYYTPIGVARYVLRRIGFFENPGPLLDPACGSGTFLIAATVGLIDKLIVKKVKLDLAISQAINLIHGLDINVFAAFIAQLQLIWHLLPYLKNVHQTELPELKIYGGINSLVHVTQKTLYASSYGLPEEIPLKIRDSKFRYVVGNPPYIRNERLKDTGAWRKNYDLVDFRNSDVAYFFVARAIEGKARHMPAWLEDEGRLCFVLPMGLCDSKSASTIRKVLYQHKILEITDLENIAIHIFPSPQASGRATVAPILLFVEKTKAEPEHKTNVVQVFEKAVQVDQFNEKWLSRSSVSQKTFRPNPINPFGQILTKLMEDDLDILTTLFAHKPLMNFSHSPCPCYGIELRGIRASEECKQNMIPLGKGQNVHSFYMNVYAREYIDTSLVPNNSIWGCNEILSRKAAYALSNIALTLQCARFDPTEFALDSAAIIFAPKANYSEFPWDSMLNSSSLRFLQLLTMRAGLVGVGTQIEGGKRAAWCHIYPRVLKRLPVAEALFGEQTRLSNITDELNSLAKSIARRWSTVDATYQESSKKPLALFGVDFNNWQLDLTGKCDFRLKTKNNVSTLKAYVEGQSTLLKINGDPSLLNVVKYLLDSRSGEHLGARELQNLSIPEDFVEFSYLINNARDPNSPDIRQFKKRFVKADRIIANAYGLDVSQWKYIQERLAKSPLDVLEPRWPWKAAAMREIKTYDTDRFA